MVNCDMAGNAVRPETRRICSSCSRPNRISTPCRASRSAKAMPGGWARRGPAQVKGLARSDQCGSRRMFNPRVCRSTLTWPT